MSYERWLPKFGNWRRIVIREGLFSFRQAVPGETPEMHLGSRAECMAVIGIAILAEKLLFFSIFSLSFILSLSF